jgi:hypothetical protein
VRREEPRRSVRAIVVHERVVREHAADAFEYVSGVVRRALPRHRLRRDAQHLARPEVREEPRVVGRIDGPRVDVRGTESVGRRGEEGARHGAEVEMVLRVPLEDHAVVRCQALEDEVADDAAILRGAVRGQVHEPARRARHDRVVAEEVEEVHVRLDLLSVRSRLRAHDAFGRVIRSEDDAAQPVRPASPTYARRPIADRMEVVRRLRDLAVPYGTPRSSTTTRYDTKSSMSGWNGEGVRRR